MFLHRIHESTRSVIPASSPNAAATISTTITAKVTDGELCFQESQRATQEPLIRENSGAQVMLSMSDWGSILWEELGEEPAAATVRDGNGIGWVKGMSNTHVYIML